MRAPLRQTSSLHDLHASELLLRLEERSDELVTEAEQIRVDEALMNRFADDRRAWERFREMRVVAQVLHRVDERELESSEIAAFEHLAHHQLEDAGIDGAGR